MINVGKKIKTARKAANITQKQLAGLTKFSRSHIGAIEIGKYNPSLDTLKTIANALGVPVASLIENDEIQTESNCNLSNDEFKIVKEYRNLNQSQKDTIINMLSFFNSAQTKSTNVNIQNHNGNGNFLNVNGNNNYLPSF